MGIIQSKGMSEFMPGKMRQILNDTAWFVSFKEGDEKAFQYVFKSCRKTIYNFAIVFLNNEMEAEEITLDTFLALWNKRSTLESPEHVLNWLYFDCRHRCINALRRPHFKTEVLEEDKFEIAGSEPNIIYERVHAELVSLIVDEVDRLPEQMRKVFVLRFANKLSPKEVADFMDIKVATVYEYTNKALKKLRNQVFDHSFETSLFVLISLFIK